MLIVKNFMRKYYEKRKILTSDNQTKHLQKCRHYKTKPEKSFKLFFNTLLLDYICLISDIIIDE